MYNLDNHLIEKKKKKKKKKKKSMFILRKWKDPQETYTE